MPLLNKTVVSIGPKGGAEGTFKKLPAITNIPDMGSDPEFVETTTIDDDTGTNELGVGSAGDVVYTMRYRTVKDKDGNDPSFKTLNALKDTITSETLYTVRNEFKSGLIVEFDVSGVSLKLLGGGLNDVKNFEASFGLASEFRFTEPAVAGE